MDTEQLPNLISLTQNLKRTYMLRRYAEDWNTSKRFVRLVLVRWSDQQINNKLD